MSSEKNKNVAFILDLVWLILVGWIPALWCLLFGALLCLTIVGIPFGTQLFKVAKAIAFPFGAEVVVNPTSHPIMNILWAIFFGWEACLPLFLVGLICCLTIIGLPLGKKCFQIGFLLLVPFGAEVR